MSEAKDDFVQGEKLEATQINKISENTNDGGGFRDDVNAGETINGGTLPVACYQDSADGELYACDANDQTKLKFIGFAISNSTDGNPIDFQGEGIVRGFSGLTPGATYYVQDDKTIGTSIGTYEVKVGIALTATELLIQKGSFEYMGNAVASGITSGSTITVPSDARFAIVKVVLPVHSGGNLENAIGELFLSKKGKTSGIFQSAANTNEQYVNASWSGTTITLTTAGTDMSGSCQGYFYK